MAVFSESFIASSPTRGPSMILIKSSASTAAGTGKTTALLNKVDDALSAGVDPTHIGYFAFTRQAANEAIERACTLSSRAKSQPRFRTLHSFALRLSGIRQEQIMQTEHYKELGHAIGFDLTAGGSGLVRRGCL